MYTKIVLTSKLTRIITGESKGTREPTRGGIVRKGLSKIATLKGRSKY